MGELDTYGELEGYPGPQIPHLDRVAAWLDDNRPKAWTPGIMHGDYHLANVLYEPAGPTWPRSSTGRCRRSATR